MIIIKHCHKKNEKHWIFIHNYVINNNLVYHFFFFEKIC